MPRTLMSGLLCAAPIFAEAAPSSATNARNTTAYALAANVLFPAPTRRLAIRCAAGSPTRRPARTLALGYAPAYVASETFKGTVKFKGIAETYTAPAITSNVLTSWPACLTACAP